MIKQLLLKPGVLGSFLIALSCNHINKTNDQKKNSIEKSELSVQENRFKAVKSDTLKLFISLKKDIGELIKTKNYNLIEKEIFGDCIYFYVTKKTGIIYKKDIIKNFNKIFDKEFKKTIENKETDKLIEENIGFYTLKEGKIVLSEELKTNNNLCISITVSIPESEYDSAKIYWFCKKNNHWIFCGLTCAG